MDRAIKEIFFGVVCEKGCEKKNHSYFFLVPSKQLERFLKQREKDGCVTKEVTRLTEEKDLHAFFAREAKNRGPRPEIGHC